MSREAERLRVALDVARELAAAVAWSPFLRQLVRDFVHALVAISGPVIHAEVQRNRDEREQDTPF